MVRSTTSRIELELGWCEVFSAIIDFLFTYVDVQIETRKQSSHPKPYKNDVCVCLQQSSIARSWHQQYNCTTTQYSVLSTSFSWTVASIPLFVLPGTGTTVGIRSANLLSLYMLNYSSYVYIWILNVCTMWTRSAQQYHTQGIFLAMQYILTIKTIAMYCIVLLKYSNIHCDRPSEVLQYTEYILWLK